MTGAGPAVTTLSPAAARAAAVVVAGLVGLLIGSFLNVVIYRVPRGLSVVRPGSFCPTCGTPVRSSDNVPVLSWLLLRGRCRSCRSPISPRYPLVEALTGGLFALVAVVAGPHPVVPACCALAATFLALAAIDLDRQPSPPAVSLIGGGLALALLLWPSVRADTWRPFTTAALAGGAALAVAGPAWLAATSAPWRGALFSLVPLGVLLGWLGQGCPGAALSGAGLAVAGAVMIGLAWPGPARGAPGPWRVVSGLPLAVSLGAVAAFAIAAAQGALSGG